MAEGYYYNLTLFFYMTWGCTLKKTLRSKDLPLNLSNGPNSLPTEIDGDLFAGGYRSNRQGAPGIDRPYGRN